MKDQSIIITKLNFLIRLLKDRHEKHYRDSHFHLWADLLLAGALVGSAVILAWLLVWQPKADFVLESRLSSARVISGQTQEFVIHFENQEETNITSASLKLETPENMEIVSTSSVFDFEAASASFNLGDLEKGAKGEIIFRALIIGPINERQSLGFALTYQKGKFKKQLLDSLIYHIDASAIELSLDLPDKTYNGIPFNGFVEIKNSGDIKIAKAGIAFLPVGWEIVPDQSVLEEGRIMVSDLGPGENRRLGFSATPDSVVSGQDFIAQGFLIMKNKAIEQTAVEKKLDVIEPSLEVSSSFKQTSFSESPVDLIITLTNSDSYDISDINLSVESQKETMSVVSINSALSSTLAANNSITIEPSLTPQAKRTIPLIVDLKRRGSALNDYVSLGIKVSYTMNKEQFSYTIAAPKLKIDSNLSVSSAGYYYGPQGDQLGIGPIPPQVDIPTTYWIIWEANNLGNDVANFEMRAELPANVVWLEQQSLVAGEISYSPVTRRVVWKIASLPQTGGNFRASFALSIVPREEDLGTVPDLLTNISFSGNDQYSQTSIVKNLANITTNIEKDSRAGGKGKVVPLE